MSLGYCIPDLIAAGRVPEKYAADLQRVYDELLLQHEGKMGRAAAEALATTQAVDAWEAGIKQARRAQLLSLNRQQAILDQARTQYRGANPDGPINPKALVAVLAHDLKAPYRNVEYVEREVRQSAMGLLYDVLEKHRTNLIGEVRNKSDLIDMVRELHGGDSGSVNAKEMADAWRQTSEYLRQRFNAAGGAIGKLDNRGLAHAHDPMRVGSVAPEAWIDEIMPMLDRKAMIDNKTLQPMSDAALRDLLRRSYDTIVSDGWVGRQPGAGNGSGMVANRHADHRVLHFKDADSWIAYNDRFGQGTPWQAMMGELHIMSRDIATTEVLGPNPAATIKWMKDIAAKEAAERGTADDIKAATKAAYMIDQMWSVLTGDMNRPVSQTGAAIGASIRQWQTATKLGSAVIASFSDVGTAALTRHYNGLSSMTQLPDMLTVLNPLDDAARVQARRMGIIGDEFIGHSSGVGRLQLEEVSGGRFSDKKGVAGAAERFAQRSTEVTRRLADGVMRVSGLNAWTMAGREAMGKEFAATFAEQAGKRFDQLDPALQGFFTRYGLGSDAWDALRVTVPDSSAGYATIWPMMIENRAVGQRLMQAMLAEIDFAVPTGGLRQRALASGGRPGTIKGELWRTGFQFKMFPITTMMIHGARMLDQPGMAGKAAYGAKYLAVTTLMGALAYQAANVAKGQDPAGMDERDFWWKAMLKGGGLGVFGDVVNSSMNEYGQDVGDLTAGPGFGTVQELANVAWGKVKTGADGEQVRERDFARLLERETPGGSIWFLRAGYQRLFLDQLKELQGESYLDSYAALDRRAKANGTDYFWKPGERLPGRAPNLANAVEPTPPVAN